MRIAVIDRGRGVQYVVGDGDGWVALDQDEYPDLPAVCADPEGVGAALRGGGRTEVDEATLRAPAVRPGKMLAIGLNYADHIRETGATRPERPVVFAKYTSSITGPYDPVEIGPEITEQADYESELAVVIGRAARRVSAIDALDHVFGYTVANDVSARDWQRSDAQFSRSKSADTFCPMGPYIVTADEVPNPSGLRVTSTVNGEARQDSTTAELLFDIPTLIEYLSATITLHAGDIILTGTPSGVGLGFTPPKFLRPGDVVECAVEGIGVIRNTFVDSAG